MMQSIQYSIRYSYVSHQSGIHHCIIIIIFFTASFRLDQMSAVQTSPLLPLVHGKGRIQLFLVARPLDVVLGGNSRNDNMTKTENRDDIKIILEDKICLEQMIDSTVLTNGYPHMDGFRMYCATAHKLIYPLDARACMEILKT